MSWTVPSGCYYAVWDDPYGSNYRWLYYGAGTTFSDGSTLLPKSSPFVLIDFTNHYIYSQVPSNYNLNGKTITVNIGNNTFSVATSLSGYTGYSVEIRAVASQTALTDANLALTGNTFSFGNGTGLRPKSDFGGSGYDVYNGGYSLKYSFQGRSDIPSSFTVPSGVTDISYAFNASTVEAVSLPPSITRMQSAFANCTNLQTVSGTISSIYSAHNAFKGCTSLTSAPTFQSGVGDNGGYFYGTFDGCTSLVTAPTIPNTNKNLSFTFRNCTSLVNVSALPSSATNMTCCFYGCTSLVNAPVIPSSVTTMSQAFQGCTSLVTTPTIPNEVTNMYCCYRDCTSLTTTTDIPSSVTNMGGTFMGCTSLTTAPTIPSTVAANLSSCFNGCTLLTGAITIDASPSNYANIFTGTENEIVLFGTGAINEIATSYENVYVWSLSQTMIARRSASPATTIDVSVDVSRFNTGTLSSLSLYRDSSTTPLSVTWNDPTLSIDSIPETFTTTLTNISESDTFTLSVVATDIYGSATAVSVKIPISFYTMDVQAGGKEIAFGGLADDDISDINGKDYTTEGLFKCKMGTNFNDMSQQEVIDFVGGLTIKGQGMADYIVEQGANYRKWNSGKAEFWYSESSSSGLNTSVWQSPINYGDYSRASLWTGVFNNPPKVYASSNHHWVIGVLPTYITKDGCTLRILTCGTASNQAYGFSIYAIGTWK